jgi:hypothetical protein
MNRLATIFDSLRNANGEADDEARRVEYVHLFVFAQRAGQGYLALPLYSTVRIELDCPFDLEQS